MQLVGQSNAFCCESDWGLDVPAELVQQPSETNIIINKQESEIPPQFS